MENNLDMIYIF